MTGVRLLAGAIPARFRSVVVVRRLAIPPAIARLPIAPLPPILGHGELLLPGRVVFPGLAIPRGLVVNRSVIRIEFTRRLPREIPAAIA